MVTLSPVAAAEIKRILESQSLEPNTVLRMNIAAGGCHGLQYSLGFDTEFNPQKDARYEQYGVTIVASKKIAVHLDGTTIDFQNSSFGQGFAIENPNYPRGGGCPGCGHH